MSGDGNWEVVIIGKENVTKAVKKNINKLYSNFVQVLGKSIKLYSTVYLMLWSYLNTSSKLLLSRR